MSEDAALIGPLAHARLASLTGAGVCVDESESVSGLPARQQTRRLNRVLGQWWSAAGVTAPPRLAAADGASALRSSPLTVTVPMGALARLSSTVPGRARLTACDRVSLQVEVAGRTLLVSALVPAWDVAGATAAAAVRVRDDGCLVPFVTQVAVLAADVLRAGPVGSELLVSGPADVLRTLLLDAWGPRADVELGDSWMEVVKCAGLVCRDPRMLAAASALA